MRYCSYCGRGHRIGYIYDGLYYCTTLCQELDLHDPMRHVKVAHAAYRRRYGHAMPAMRK